MNRQLYQQGVGQTGDVDRTKYNNDQAKYIKE
jgi:hypothetical protein